jgi:predicted nucleic acid-binding protein
MTDSLSLVICDAGPLIHLDELRCLDVLADIEDIYVPRMVWEEVKRYQPSALRRRRISLTRIDDDLEPSPRLAALRASIPLHKGEMAALALMERYPGAMLLTDDSAARSVAESLAFEVHGTIGMILRAWRKGLRTKDQVVRLLQMIPSRSTLFVSKALLTRLLEEVRT